MLVVELVAHRKTVILQVCGKLRRWEWNKRDENSKFKATPRSINSPFEIH